MPVKLRKHTLVYGLAISALLAAGTFTALFAGRAAVSRDAVMAVKEDW